MASPAPRPQDHPDYRPDIDGLRALAVIGVVCFHAQIWPMRSGYAGVDIFFVISGFLIGRIIWRAAEARSFRHARFHARRILPAQLFARD